MVVIAIHQTTAGGVYTFKIHSVHQWHMSAKHEHDCRWVAM